VVERGPFKSEVEGSIPSALTMSQLSILDSDAPFFSFPFSFFMLNASKYLGPSPEILRFAQDDTNLTSVLPTFNEKR
jgi:hypothetical protein